MYHQSLTKTVNKQWSSLCRLNRVFLFFQGGRNWNSFENFFPLGGICPSRFLQQTITASINDINQDNQLKNQFHIIPLILCLFNRDFYCSEEQHIMPLPARATAAKMWTTPPRIGGSFSPAPDRSAVNRPLNCIRWKLLSYVNQVKESLTASAVASAFAFLSLISSGWSMK